MHLFSARAGPVLCLLFRFSPVREEVLMLPGPRKQKAKPVDHRALSGSKPLWESSLCMRVGRRRGALSLESLGSPIGQFLPGPEPRTSLGESRPWRGPRAGKEGAVAGRWGQTGDL